MTGERNTPICAQAISIERIAGVLESAMDKVKTLIDHLVRESVA